MFSRCRVAISLFNTAQVNVSIVYASDTSIMIVFLAVDAFELELLRFLSLEWHLTFSLDFALAGSLVGRALTYLLAFACSLSAVCVFCTRLIDSVQWSTRVRAVRNDQQCSAVQCEESSGSEARRDERAGAKQTISVIEITELTHVMY